MEERNAHAPPPSLVPRLHSIIHLKLKHNNPNVPTEKAKLNSGRDNNIDVSILEHRRFIYFSFLLIRLWTYIYPLFIKNINVYFDNIQKLFCLWCRCKFLEDRDFYAATSDPVSPGAGDAGRLPSSRILPVSPNLFCVSVRGTTEVNNTTKVLCILHKNTCTVFHCRFTRIWGVLQGYLNVSVIIDPSWLNKIGLFYFVFHCSGMGEQTWCL